MGLEMLHLSCSVVVMWQEAATVSALCGHAIMIAVAKEEGRSRNLLWHSQGSRVQAGALPGFSISLPCWDTCIDGLVIILQERIRTE